MHPGFIQLSVQSSRELGFWITELRSWMKSGYNLDPFISLQMACFPCIGPERGTFGA
jgi:hypothetical protein